MGPVSVVTPGQRAELELVTPVGRGSRGTSYVPRQWTSRPYDVPRPQPLREDQVFNQCWVGMTKKIGFLSFGHWTPSPHSAARSASDVLLQSIDLAVAAEELGVDGAYFRVHHFARQLASPFPLLAAVGARTSRIEIGTGVIDMRYENPLYMAEDAGAADLISGGRLQLGISRGVTGAGRRRLPLLRLRAGRRRPRRDGAPAHLGAARRADRPGVRRAQPAPDVPEPAGTAAHRAALGGSAGPDLVGRRLPVDRGVGRRAGA